MSLPRQLGTQYIIELYGCDKDLLDQPTSLQTVMHNTALACGATVVQQFFHQFAPQGVSGTIVIAESHLNIHTWPEYGYAAVDIFTCGDSLDPQAGMLYIKEQLKADRATFNEIARGTDLRVGSHKA